MCHDVDVAADAIGSRREIKINDEDDDDVPEFLPTRVRQKKFFFKKKNLSGRGIVVA